MFFFSFVDCFHFCVGGYCGCCVVVDCFLFVLLLLLLFFVVFIIVVVINFLIIAHYCLGVLVMALPFVTLLIIYFCLYVLCKIKKKM